MFPLSLTHLSLTLSLYFCPSSFTPFLPSCHLSRLPLSLLPFSPSLSPPVVPINGHVDLKTSLTPPLITHTAATPMPVPKLPAVGDPALGYESRRGSNVSMDLASYDKSPVSIL